MSRAPSDRTPRAARSASTRTSISSPAYRVRRRNCSLALGQRLRQVGVDEQTRDLIRVCRRLTLDEYERVVVVTRHRADDAGILVEDVIDAGVGRREPASLHRAGHPDSCLRTFAGSSRRDVERDQELAVANAALRTDNGSVARRQEHARRARFPAAAHAIGIAREERAAEHRLVHRCGRGSIPSHDEGLEGARRPQHMIGQVALALDGAQEVARCRRTLACRRGRRSLRHRWLSLRDRWLSFPDRLIVAFRQEGAGDGRLACAVGSEQDRRQPGVHGKPLHPAVRRRSAGRRSWRRDGRGARTLHPRGRQMARRTSRTSGDRRPRRGCRARWRKDPRAGSPAHGARAGDRPGATA